MNFIYSNCEFKFYKEGEEPVKPAEPES